MRRCQSALASASINIAEEPSALVGHGGICEGGARSWTNESGATQKIKINEINGRGDRI